MIYMKKYASLLRLLKKQKKEANNQYSRELIDLRSDSPTYTLM